MVSDKVVITSDHGNALGERARPIPINLLANELRYFRDSVVLFMPAGDHNDYKAALDAVEDRLYRRLWSLANFCSTSCLVTLVSILLVNV
jgi:hypothetical protein